MPQHTKAKTLSDYSPIKYNLLNSRTGMLWLLSWALLFGYSMLIYGLIEHPWSLSLLAIINTLLSVCIVLCIRFLFRFEWASVPLVYIYYLSLAHVPFLTLWTINKDAIRDRFYPWQIEWVRVPDGSIAALLVFIGLTSFLVGIIFTVSHDGSATDMAATSMRLEEPWLFVAGLIISAAALLMFLFAVRRGGGIDGLLTAPYSSIIANVYTSGFYINAIFLNAVGTGIALAGVDKSKWPLALIPFSILALLLLAGGDRGSVFYPLLTYAAILNKKNIHLPRLVVIGIVVAVFILVPTISQVRNRGVTNTSIDDLRLSLQAPFIEIGFTVNTVALTYDKIQRGNLQHVYGGTYWLPIERQLARFAPSIERTELDKEPRNAKIIAGSRAYSPIAEAYYNFGILGPLLVFPIIGYLLGRLDRIAKGSPYRLASVAIILFVLIDNVRNSFISVPARVALGLVVLSIIWLFGQLHSKIHQNPRKVAHHVSSNQHYWET